MFVLSATAEKYLRRALEKDEGSAPIRFDLADAAVFYRTVLAFDPEHLGAVEALTALGEPLGKDD